MFRGLFKKIDQLITGRGRVDDALFDELEEMLIQSDVSVHTTLRIVEELRAAAASRKLASADDVRRYLREQLAGILRSPESELLWSAALPTVYLMVGVNGTGKTTTTAKVAYHFKQQGRRVLLAAADTFRAAAIDQLEIWAGRVGVDLVKHKEGADPAAVVYDAIQAARSRRVDLVVADTAGRLHTKTNLMEELKKVHRVVERELGRTADEVLLVLDATIGQNALSQARTFAEALPLTGLVLAKLDGTARGGIVVTLKDELSLPIKLIGTGEKAGDLELFQPDRFVAQLFDDDGA
jgi:fused signal recognition particle receptor